MVQITEIQNIVKKYKGLLRDIDLLIKESGYRPSYIADKLNLSRSAFYAKRKNGTFTVGEIDRIVEILLVSSEPETYTDEGFPSDQETSAEIKRIMESEELTFGHEALLEILKS
jgi:hypothetical protein